MLDKDTYVKGVEREVAELGEKIDQLKSDSSTLSHEARGRVETAIKRATELQAALRAQISEVQSAGVHAWSDLRDGVAKAKADLAEAVDKALGEFRGIKVFPSSNKSSSETV